MTTIRPWPRPDPDLPALTSAEADVIDSYLAALRYLGRSNPAREDRTYNALIAAQALVAYAARLRDALALMYERGQQDLHISVMARALRVLDAPHNIAQITLPVDLSVAPPVEPDPAG